MADEAIQVFVDMQPSGSPRRFAPRYADSIRASLAPDGGGVRLILCEAGARLRQ